MMHDTKPDRPAVLHPPPELRFGIQLLSLGYDVHRFRKNADLPKFLQTPPGWEGWALEPLRRDGVEILLAEAPNRDLWIAVMGTNGAGDWLRNVDPHGLRIGKLERRYPGRFRRGFARHGRHAWDLIRERVHETRGRIRFFGHSLGGGALPSILARIEILDDPAKVATAITLAAPRSVDAAAARCLESTYAGRLFAFELGADIVPHLVSGISGWRTPGAVRFIDRDGRIHARRSWRREVLHSIGVPGIQTVSHHDMASWRAVMATRAA